MVLLSTFDIDANFWIMHPQLKIAFKDLYDNDESKDHEESSQVMWAIALAIHPDSSYSSENIKSRKKLIQENYLNVEEFDWKQYEKEIKLFKRFCLTRAQKTLVSWKNKLEQIEDFLDTQVYDFSNRKDIEDALKSLNTLWNRYRECEKQVEEEKASGVTEGNQMQSLSDLNELY